MTVVGVPIPPVDEPVVSHWCTIADLVTRYKAREVYGAVGDNDAPQLQGGETDSNILALIAGSDTMTARADAAITDAESALRGALSRYTLPDTPTDWLRMMTTRAAFLCLRRRGGFTPDDPDAKEFNEMMQGVRDGDEAPPGGLRLTGAMRPALVESSSVRFASF